MALRAQDFSPTAIPQSLGGGGGGASVFLDFLEHELIPFIDHTYRTNPADRGLLGHSMGGSSPSTRSSSAPACFSALSPPARLFSRTTLMAESARRALSAHSASARLDLSVGSDDQLGFAETTTAFAQLLGELKPKGLDYRFTVYPGQNHDSVRLASFPAGLYWVYRQTR